MRGTSAISYFSAAAALILYLLGCAIPAGDSAEADFSGQSPGGTTPSPAPAPAPNPAAYNGLGSGGGPLNTGHTGTFVLHQNDFTSTLSNRDGGTTKREGIAVNVYGSMAFMDPNDGYKLKFLTVDYFNTRVLIYNSIPTSAAALPDVVVGQPDFVTATVHSGGGTDRYGFNLPRGATVCPDGKLFVADTNNHRILAWNSVPTASFQPADFVIGQLNFSGNTSGTSATKLKQPQKVGCADGKLFVSDVGNNRVVVYDPIPSATNPSASFAIGQPDLDTAGANCTATGLSSPWDVHWTGSQLLISDASNSRVLIYNSMPTASNAAADGVLGQTNLTTCTANQGGGVTATSLNIPRGLGSNGTKLAVGDNSNNRVLFYDLPVATNQAASYVIGQANLTSGSAVAAASNRMRWAVSLTFDGNYIWVTDYVFTRVLLYPLPF